MFFHKDSQLSLHYFLRSSSFPCCFFFFFFFNITVFLFVSLVDVPSLQRQRGERGGGNNNNKKNKRKF